LSGAPAFFEVLMEGTIARFLEEKFCGFVENEGGRWFFHGSAVLNGPVTKGDAVSFNLTDDARRPGELKAIDLQKLRSASTPDPARLFFANLPYSVSEAEISDCFGQYGSVEKLDLVRDSDTGESRGFGFVQMVDARSALNAIAQLHGRDLHSRRISVHLAQQRPRPVSRQAEQRS
jgi:cold shock CspA family protein